MAGYFDENRKGESGDSLYSYDYRDREQSRTVHEGDYNARRDSGRYSYEDPGRTAGYGNRSYQNPYQQNQYGASYGNTGRKAGRMGSVPFGMKIVRCAILAAVCGLVAGGVFRGVSGAGRSGSPGSAAAEQTPAVQVEKTATSTAAVQKSPVVVSDVSAIVENVMPSIVAITNMSQTEYYNWFGQTQVYDSESCGSGIIVADDEEYLYVATNNHVVAGANSLTICFCDDTTVAAEIKGTDQGSDLAVVSVKKAELSAETLASVKIATRGDSGSLKVGQPAIAIGNALGYGQSVTTGVISALDREVTTKDQETGEAVTNELVQTDAAINPGNSGGALLNAAGEVVGINSIKYSDTDVEGMGYAIPMETAGPIIDELITRQVVDRAKSAYIGIVGVDVTADVSAAYHMPEGVYIAQISGGGAADLAGLKRGDIITSFDGHSVRSMDALEEQMQYYEAGTVVDVTVWRAKNGNYEEMDISVTLGSKK